MLLLEALAVLLAAACSAGVKFKPLTQRLRLAFWVNEEQPYGKSPDMGSWQHAKALRDRGENIEGMIALETIGFFQTSHAASSSPRRSGSSIPTPVILSLSWDCRAHGAS